MSKKKSFAGSTMTLKDFHGGSIPSDLPLPSAPGVSVRPPDRPPAWGARGDHTLAGGSARARPSSAGSARAGLEDRVSPFLPIHAHVGRHFDEDERKPLDSSSAAAATPRRAATPIPPGLAQHGAWAPPASAVANQQPSMWTPAPVSASKLVQASAAEKIASGQWQLKQDVEVNSCQETEILERRFSESLSIGLNVEREKNSVRSPKHLDPRDDVSERPKLKLLPRTKTLETPEIPPCVEEYQVQIHQLQLEPVHVITSPVAVVVGSSITPKPSSAGEEVGNLPVERPRLNLKPRSQILEQLEDNSGRARKSVFGGARPRELVLKERGADPSSQLDATVWTDRANYDVPKPEPKHDTTTPTVRPITRAETSVPEQRSGKEYEMKNHRSDHGKLEARGRSWRNEQKKNTREIEKPKEQRRPEPDTWRKPMEEPKAAASRPNLGKGASALELAQAFSRSVSDNQQGLPSRSQVPFSRLTDTRELYSGRVQRQINGY